MAHYKRTKSGWKAEVEKLGIRVSMTWPSKSAAINWATNTEAEILNRKRGVVTDGGSLFDALKKYKAEVSTTKKSEDWEIKKIEFFEKKMPFIGRPLQAITTEDIEKWRDLRLKTIKSASVCRELAILNSVFMHCVKKWRWLHENPMAELVWPKASKARTRRVHWTETKKICRALGYSPLKPVDSRAKETAAAFLLSLRTAMRSSEVLGLKKEDVDIVKRVAHLYDTKNGDDRDVPLTKGAVRLICKLSPPALGSRYFKVLPARRDSLFREARDKSGIKDLHFHDARAEALTILSKRVDVMTLARISGHRDIKVLIGTYYRETAAEIAARL
jgi:integrase